MDNRREVRLSPKLRPPATAANVLRRPQLEARLDEALVRRLCLVVADAGFGKSTLLASWAADVEAGWYTVTAEDVSLATFARGVAAALQVPAPGLGIDARALDVSGRDGEERAQTFAGVLSDAVEAAVPHDLVLILDDVHELGPASSSVRLIDALCRNAPPSFHVVVASREEPPFPVARLRAQGQVLELRAADLRFGVDETAALLRGEVGPDAERLAEALTAATGGWPAAVRLAVESLRTRPPGERAAAIEKLGAPGSPMYAFLAEEVFAREQEDVIELLALVAPLDRFSADLCAHLGAERPDEILAGLARRGLFVETYGDGGWFAVNELVRDYVSRGDSFRDARNVHRRAAEWFDEHGLLRDALRSLAANGEHAALSRYLATRGEELLAAGAAEEVVACAERLPVASRTPEVERVIGQAHAVRGDLEEALQCFDRARGDSDALSLALAWRVALAHHLRDDLQGVVDTFERTRGVEGDPRDRALLLSWVAAAKRRLGDRAQAQALAHEALDAALASGDDTALAGAHTAVGVSLESDDVVANEWHYRHALAAADRAGDVLQAARCRNNVGSMLLEQGRYREAIAALDHAMHLAEVGGFASIRALALMNRGLCSWCLGRLDEASADYEAAIELYRRAGSQEVAYALIGRGDVHRERGELVLARAAYDEGLAIATRSGDLQGIVPGLYQQAKVLVNDEPDRALELAERAVSYGWPDRSWALNAVGWIELVRGERERAGTQAAAAAAAARDLNDRFGLAESHELAAVTTDDPTDSKDQLEAAAELWREIGNELREAVVELALARLSPGRDASPAERRLRALGVRISATGPAGLLRVIARPPDVPVAMKAFGGFQLLRYGEPVPLTAWQSKKARDLLKILVSRRGRPVARDVVMDALWPGDAPAKLSGRLSVALSTLRAVLDPEKRYAAEHFVRADKDAIALEVERVVLDVESFFEHAAEGHELRRAGAPRGAELLELAESEYAGDFLEEDRYEDWAVALREEARATYVAVARALADDAAASGDNDRAVGYFLRVLEKDAYDEQAHLQLVATLVAAGRHGDARRSYRLYVARMRELSVEPAPFPGAGRTGL